MNSTDKLHQARLNEWAALISEQQASGLTAKEWCARNNVTIHKYNYWKHLLKEQVTDSVLPDIVPVSLPMPKPYELRESFPTNTISLSINGITIQVPSQLIPMLPDIIKAVRYT